MIENLRSQDKVLKEENSSLQLAATNLQANLTALYQENKTLRFMILFF